MAELQPGQMLGPYRIIEPVGQGGMATVYKAYHAAMDRYVAVKIIPFQFAEKEAFIDRFRREVKLIAGLEHPHILPVYDSGELDGLPYLVMRYLDTGTLKQRMESGSLSLDETTHILNQLAGALGYAHENGVIHRDVKPANVLLSGRNDVFLTDFGIAKAIEESTSEFTAAGAITGTPAYMSPEQAQGEKLDGRSDIYALGIMLFEMVTGRVPYEADTPLAVILKHLQAQLPLPSTIKPDIHPALEQVILKALAKNRDDRFDTMADLAAAWTAARQLAQTSGTQAGLTRQSPLPAVPDNTAAMPAALAPARSPAEATTPLPTALGPTPPAPPTAAPAQPLPEPRRARFASVFLAGSLIFLLAVCLILGAVLARNFIRAARANATAATETGDETNGGLAGERDDYVAAALANDAFSWETWAPVNFVYTIAADGEFLYAGGPGGVVRVAPNRESFEFIPLPAQIDDPAVFDIAIDENGVMWLATNSGVVRYEEDEWAVYDMSDGLDSDYVRTLLLVDDNVLAGSVYSYPGGGLNVFDGSSWSDALSFPSGEGEDEVSWDVNTLAMDPNGNLWVGTTHGLAVYDGESWTVETGRDYLADPDINVFYFDDAGNAFVGAEEGALRYDGAEIVAIEMLAEQPVRGISQDLRGRYWFSAGGGLFRLNPALADWEYFGADTGDLPTYNLGGIWRGPNGRLFIASDVGIVMFDGDDFNHFYLPGQPALAEADRIFANPAAPEQIWFAKTYAEFTDAFDREADTWLQPPEIACSPLGFDPDGRLWCLDGPLIVQDDEEDIVFDGASGFPDAYVTRLAFGLDGEVWVATEAGLVIIVDDVVDRVVTTSDLGLSDPEIWTLAAGLNYDAWFGNGDGLVHIWDDGTYDLFAPGDPFGEDFAGVISLAAAADGTIWVGTYGDGLWRYHDDEWTHYHPAMSGVGLPQQDVMALAVSDSGGVWAGTYEGVSYFDGTNWFVFDRDDGLVNQAIMVIFQDDSGDIWFAGPGGVNRLVFD